MLTVGATSLSMAECVASPLCVKLHMQRKHVNERVFSSQTTNFKFVRRSIFLLNIAFFPIASAPYCVTSFVFST